MIETHHFAFLREFIKTETGIVLRDDQLDFAAKRLKPLCRQYNTLDTGVLISKAEDEGETELRRELLELVLENETIFFKGFEAFKFIRDVLIPQFSEGVPGSKKQLRIWCAACGVGQDPYSLSIFIKDGIPALANWEVEILATDLSQSAIDRASRGEFNQLEVSRGLPAKLLIRHFSRAGMNWVVNENLKDNLNFFKHNLIQEWKGLGRFDLIMLRDVLTYFPDDTQDKLAGKLIGHLNPGGYVLVGQNETLRGLERVEDAPVPCYQLGRDARVQPGSSLADNQDPEALDSLDAHLDTIQRALGELDGESFDNNTKD